MKKKIGKQTMRNAIRLLNCFYLSVSTKIDARSMGTVRFVIHYRYHTAIATSAVTGFQ